MGIGTSQLIKNIISSIKKKPDTDSPAPQQSLQSQYTSPLAGLDAIYGQYQQPSAQQQPLTDMLYRGVPQQLSYLTNPYAAPFQQRYVQQFYPEAESFVPQSAENYRSPFAGGMGGRGERTYFDLTRGTTPPAAPPPPTPSYDEPIYEYPPMASGGVIKAAAGRYLQGPGDGTSDSIPATIGNAQPARLADGEFVIDARTVSEIGNGSSNAGAKKLYAMMERVHRERKKAKRGQDSNADRFLPR